MGRPGRRQSQYLDKQLSLVSIFSFNSNIPIVEIEISMMNYLQIIDYQFKLDEKIEHEYSLILHDFLFLLICDHVQFDFPNYIYLNYNTIPTKNLISGKLPGKILQ